MDCEEEYANFDIEGDSSTNVEGKKRLNWGGHSNVGEDIVGVMERG